MSLSFRIAQLLRLVKYFIPHIVNVSVSVSTLGKNIFIVSIIFCLHFNIFLCSQKVQKAFNFPSTEGDGIYLCVRVTVTVVLSSFKSWGTA